MYWHKCPSNYGTRIRDRLKQTEQPTDKTFELQAQKITFNSAPAMNMTKEVYLTTGKRSHYYGYSR
jgi:hypothetical protein